MRETNVHLFHKFGQHQWLSSQRIDGVLLLDVLEVLRHDDDARDDDHDSHERQVAKEEVADLGVEAAEDLLDAPAARGIGGLGVVGDAGGLQGDLRVCALQT